MIYIFFNSDIALIRLPRRVPFSEYVRRISLSSAPIFANTQVITLGYGLVKNSVFPDNLQHTKFQTTECAPHTLDLVPKDSLVCAKGVLSSLCVGDMGDPLVSGLTGKLVGVAISTFGDCDVDRPQTYISVSPYIDWIHRTMDSFSFVQNTPDVRI